MIREFFARVAALLALLWLASPATAQDIQARGLAAQAQTALTAKASQTGEYDLTAAEYLKAAKPLLKLVPPGLRAQLLAGVNGPTAPDYCPYIQKGLELYRVVDLQGLQVNCLTGIKASGFQELQLNGGRIWANLTDQNEALFSPKTVPGQPLITQFYLRGFGSITGSSSAVQFKAAFVAGSSTKIVVDNVAFNGLTRRANTRVLDVAQVDFVQFTNNTILNYDQAIRFTAPVDGSGRVNTQVIVEGDSVTNVNSGAYIERVLLGRFNIDLAGVGGGLVIGPGNGQVDLNNNHCENQAQGADYKNADDEAAGYSRWGWCVNVLDGNSQAGDIVLNGGSIFGRIAASPDNSVALGGIYLGKHDNGTTANIVFNSVQVLPTSVGSASYAPLEAHYNLRWNGKWISGIQNNVRLGIGAPGDTSPGDLLTDIVIDEGQKSNRAPRNLLAGTKVINLTQTTGSGTITVAESSTAPFESGHLITWTASSVTELYRDVALGVGWHTMMVSGNSVSGLAYASIRSSGGTIILRKLFQNPSSVAAATYHMPVYIDTAGTYRVGFYAATNSTAIVDEVGLVRGLWSGEIPPGAWTYPPVTTLPTCSARWEGKGLTLLGASNANSVSICLNTTSGYAWKLITLSDAANDNAPSASERELAA